MANHLTPAQRKKSAPSQEPAQELGNAIQRASAPPAFQLKADQPGNDAKAQGGKVVEESGTTQMKMGSPMQAKLPGADLIPGAHPANAGTAQLQKDPNAPIQRETPAAALNNATGQSLSGHSLSMSTTLAGGQNLFSQDPIRVHTGEGVTASVGISARQFWVNFSPSMTIEYNPGSWLPNVDINLQGYTWDFASQTLSVRWRARRIVNWLGDPGTKIHEAMEQHVLSKLPARMSARGYNPFNDPDILNDLRNLFQSSGGATAPAIPRNSNANLTASVTLDRALQTDAGGYQLSIPAGTSISITAHAAGGISSDLANARIDSITVRFSGGDANVDVSVMRERITAVNFRSITFHHGGRISADYGLVTETLESLGRLLIMAGQLQSGQYAGVNSIESSRHTAIRQRIDQGMNDGLIPRLRELVAANRNVVPGVDIGRVLGL